MRRSKALEPRSSTPARPRRGCGPWKRRPCATAGGPITASAFFDGILIKDNHIAAAGSITEAVVRAKKGAPHTLKVEVEVEDLAGLEEAIQAGAHTVLLDNMTPEQLSAAVKAAAGRAALEASGGVNLDTVAQIAASGVDYISVGALTHSAPAADLSLRFK